MEYNKKDFRLLKDDHLQPEFDIIWEALWDYQDEILGNKSDYSSQESEAKWDDICGAMATITESLCDGDGCGYQDVDIEKGK